MPADIQIATRKSPLALKQSELALACLQTKLPDEKFALLKLSTRVDERLNWSLEKRGGIGLFTKELEAALLEGRADLAIHSAKDLPTTSQKGLSIAGYLPRARVNDVLVHRSEETDLKIIASSSPRRRAQVGILHPEAEWTTIRGNVGTRLKKIAQGDCDASLLAAAGLDRLGIDAHPGLEFVELPVDQVVPAPGQAAIAVQCRTEDLPKFKDSFCPETELAVSLEKSFLRRLGSGCQIPVGAYYEKDQFRIYHPKTGYQTFKISLRSLDQIEPQLDAIMKELQL
ncbi:MAG: hydroxymethylbilane synthase [Verrucomicrobia bacterium]|jgi:hydroxymethylbilane synthase|nr:hydroxymethylbilane synthase [Verrucomicrobiota bacterium]